MFTDRRRVLTLLAASFTTPAFAQAPAMTRITAYAFSFPGSRVQTSSLLITLASRSSSSTRLLSVGTHPNMPAYSSFGRAIMSAG